MAKEAVDDEQYDMDRSAMMAHLSGFIEANFGERCSTTDADCPTCKLWKLHDEICAITNV